MRREYLNELVSVIVRDDPGVRAVGKAGAPLATGAIEFHLGPGTAWCVSDRQKYRIPNSGLPDPALSYAPSRQAINHFTQGTSSVFALSRVAGPCDPVPHRLANPIARRGANLRGVNVRRYSAAIPEGARAVRTSPGVP